MKSPVSTREIQSDRSLKVGSKVVVGTPQGSFVAEIRKITKKDLVIRPITRPIR
jgi:hypothetical protein